MPPALLQAACFCVAVFSGYVYTGLNQLARVGCGSRVSEYTYRSDGLRSGKKITVTRGNTPTSTVTNHYWDGQEMVMESGAGYAAKAVYLRGANLIAQKIAGLLHYYTCNAPGCLHSKQAGLTPPLAVP